MPNPCTEEVDPSKQKPLSVKAAAWSERKSACRLFNQASHFSCVAVGQVEGARATVCFEVAEGDLTSRLTGRTEWWTAVQTTDSAKVEEAHAFGAAASVRGPGYTKTPPSDLVSSSPPSGYALQLHAFFHQMHQRKCSGVLVILSPASLL